ncbi:MAG: YjbF family lipoprotein [Thalassovita sp.]
MSRLSFVKRPALACLAALMIAGCSNASSELNLKSALKSVFNRSENTQAAAPAKVDINTILRQTAPASLVLVNLTDHDNISALMLEIESNGGFRTYGTAAKQSVTFRNGLITSTRGLGDDLMASISGDSRALIRARRAGTGTRVMDHVNGAGELLRQTFSCETFVTGSGRVKQGAVNAATTELTENCASAQNKFTNVYQISGSGMILSSTQWIGPGAGYVEVKVLRP